MLMQNFKPAADLGISEAQKEALMKTLVLLETGKLKHVPGTEFLPIHQKHATFDGLFNMCVSFGRADCGTICCILGTAALVGNTEFGLPHEIPYGLRELAYGWKGMSADTSQAARALRSYLTTGDAKWTEAVSVTD